jgi:type IV pilus assembly protein PilA
MVKSGSANSNGVITILGNETNLGGQVTNAANAITLVPIVSTTLVYAAANGGGLTVYSWRCGLVGDGTTMPARYLPGSCRGV